MIVVRDSGCKRRNETVKRTFLTVLVAVMFMPGEAETLSVSESESLMVDSRLGMLYQPTTNGVYQLSYNSAWVGDAPDAEIAIADNGMEVARRSGIGVVEWRLPDYGKHVLTYTTYIGGVEQDEVYTAIFEAINCEGMGEPGLQRVTFTGSAYDASNAVLGGEPIITLTGEGMYSSDIPQQTTYAYTGYMYFRGGETYTFRGYFDDYATVLVDNLAVVKKGTSECQDGSGTVSFEISGWHKVDFRVANNGGEGGPKENVGILYKTDVDPAWRKIEDDGSGTIFRTGPEYCGVRILSARMRPSDPTIMDIVYKVTSPKETVKVRALAYEDGNRSFKNAVPVLTFADNTGVNVGDNITANEEHTISWQVAADWATDLTKVRVEVMVMEDSLLPLHLVTIPATPNHASIQYSDTQLNSTAVLNALFWLYASQDDDLYLQNGVLSNQFNTLVNGTTIKNGSATVGWLYAKMGYSVLGGNNLNYVNATARINLVPSDIKQYAVKTIK